MGSMESREAVDIQRADGQRRERSDAVRNRASLIEAARTVFRKDGLSAQMDAIAAQAGLAVGTLYRHFPTKEALVDAMVEEYRNMILDSVVEAQQALDPWEGLRGFLWRIGRLQTEDRGFSDMLGHPGRRLELQQLCLTLADDIEPVVVRAQATGQMRNDVTAEDILIGISVGGRMMHAGYDDGAGRWNRLLGVFIDGLQRM